MVRLVKDLLKRTLGITSLSYEELNTTLCECESVINARPITYSPEDKNNICVISPDMFLKEIHVDGVPDIDEIEKTSLSRKLRYRQRLREEIKDRFRTEYLGQLSRRTKVNKDLCKTLKVGDLFFISTDNQKACKWPLARIQELIPGNDGEIRTVKLKTSSNVLVRPVQRLISLEADSDEYLPKSVEKSTEKSTPEECSEEPIDEDRQDRGGSSSGDTMEPPQNASEVQQVLQTRRGRAVKMPKRYIE